MERNWSVEDLVGGLWRVGRTDSEQQLQEYLRRVPSGTWPGPTPPVGQQGVADYQAQQQAQLVDAVQAQAAYAQAMQAQMAGAGGKGPEMVPGTSTSNGMQRVASLDMLRALVLQQNQGQQMPMQVPPNSGMHAPPTRPLPNAPMAQTLDVKGMGMNVVPGNANKPHGDMHATLNEIDTKNMDKTEVRRARRMLSNRESARRSRKRKQEHLETLETKLKGVEKENASLKKKVQDLTSKLKKVQGEKADLEKTLNATNKQNANLAVQIEEHKEANGTSELNKSSEPRKGNSLSDAVNGSPSQNSKGSKPTQDGGDDQSVRKVTDEERRNSVEEVTKRMKTKTALANGHKESWQDLTKAEQDRLVH